MAAMTGAYKHERDPGATAPAAPTGVCAGLRSRGAAVLEQATTAAPLAARRKGVSLRPASPALAPNGSVFSHAEHVENQTASVSVESQTDPAAPISPFDEVCRREFVATLVQAVISKVTALDYRATRNWLAITRVLLRRKYGVEGDDSDGSERIALLRREQRSAAKARAEAKASRTRSLALGAVTAALATAQATRERYGKLHGEAARATQRAHVSEVELAALREQLAAVTRENATLRRAMKQARHRRH